MDTGEHFRGKEEGASFQELRDSLAYQVRFRMFGIVVLTMVLADELSGFGKGFSAFDIRLGVFAEIARGFQPIDGLQARGDGPVVALLRFRDELRCRFVFDVIEAIGGYGLIIPFA